MGGFIRLAHEYDEIATMSQAPIADRPDPDGQARALRERAKALEALLDQYREEGLNLDLTRGKPSDAQLDLLNGFDGVLMGDYRCEAGLDARNYGPLDGLPEMKRLCAAYLDVAEDEVLADGNSSLQLMYQFVLWALHFGPDSKQSWTSECNPVKFLCPVPGYDRHFALCEELGIEMIPVPMTDTGPDMDTIERHLDTDPNIRGLWCVPKYSNPTGVTYSDATVARIVALAKRAAPSFRVLWDNAYAVHDLTDTPPRLASVMALAKAVGTADSIIQFGSTSKISLAGAGIAFLGATPANLGPYLKRLSLMTIGPDKVNQLRHTRYFKNIEGIHAHMQKHAEILKPKFARTLEHLNEALGGKGLGSWTVPQGGYFVSFTGLSGTASRIVALATDAGVKLTPAGAAFPCGNDPDDAHIRLAPTFPSLPEVDKAMGVFVTCAELVAIRRQLGAND